MLQSPNGKLFELSTQNLLVKALMGNKLGDERFYFPLEMFETGVNLYSDDYKDFQDIINQLNDEN